MKVGLLCGREYAFPPAFIERVNRLGAEQGITAEFVTLTGTSQKFRLERKDDGTVEATMEWTGPDGNPNRTAYILEPLKK